MSEPPAEEARQAFPPATSPVGPTGPSASATSPPAADKNVCPTERKKRQRRYLALALAWLLLTAGAAQLLSRTYVPPFVRLEYLWQESALTRLPPAEFEAQLAADAAELRGLLRQLARQAEELTALKAGLPQAAAALAPDERRRLKDLWQAFLDVQVALDRIEATYQAFPGLLRQSAPETNWRCARAFALAWLAHLARLDAGGGFIDGLQGRRDYENVLDEAEPARGIPAGCYARLKLRLVHLQTWAELRLLQEYFEYLRPRQLDAYASAAPNAPDRWVPAALEAFYPKVRDWYSRNAPGALAANAADLVREDCFAAWFPVQSRVAEWLGDTRLSRRPGLIAPAQVAALGAVLRPGDILLERRNWFLSNAGLPGFWPHAALYLGTPEEAAREFADDPDCRAFLAQAGAADLTELIERRSPAATAAWHAAGAGEGEGESTPFRVLEAVSEGVVFSSLEHTCAADYVAALRPNLRPVDRLQALLAALAEWGKPYDFNFDFATDDAIVCSELVYRAYLPEGDGKRGLTPPLTTVLGRQALPPHELVGWLRGFQDDPAAAPLACVYFLEGLEKEGRARLAAPAELLATYDRPKWDILQR